MSRAASDLLLAIASAIEKIVSVSRIVIGAFGLSFETGRSSPVTFFAAIFLALESEGCLTVPSWDRVERSPDITVFTLPSMRIGICVTTFGSSRRSFSYRALATTISNSVASQSA